MKRLSILVLMLLALVTFASPSFANVDRPMQAHPGAGELAAACGANGGSFTEGNELGFHSYSCTKSNCDGKGGSCSVNCGDKGCTGSTPSRIVHANLRMLLNDGELVNHVYAPSEGPTRNPNGGADAAAAPTAPVVVIY